MEVGGGRRRRFLSEEKVDSPNLRDFLRVKQDGQSNLSPSVTLGAILSQKRPPAAAALVNRTLLDIIRDNPNRSNHHGNRMTWRSFKDKIRLRQAGITWTSSVPTPVSDVPSSSSATVEEVIQSELGPNSSRMPSLSATTYRRGTEFSTLLATMTNLDREEEGEEDGERESEESEDGREPQARMSLMALLAETDRQMGLDGSTFVMDEDEDEDEEEGVSLGVEYKCCVCMIRHKGAALIPCGHTFCRLCSRELWVQRGNCPLCNKLISEILDIF